ncbi:MAG: PASTA domain-containing protein [Gammaproteobacteria bacterium]|nr:PASTA domain-containing protein [Gammaproteobacteria bacterium]
MSFARIQPITDKLTCKAGETVECAFDIFNTTAQTATLGIEPMGDMAAAGQVSLKGATEIELQANGQEKVLVSITVPAEAADGDKPSNFSLRVYNVRDTEQTVESNTVAVEVEEAVVKPVDTTATTKKTNWGLIIGGIVGGLVLLIGGGIGIYFLVSGSSGVPDVVNMTVEEAIEALEEDDLVAIVSESASLDEDADPGTIISQDPEAGEDAPDNGEIALVMVQASIKAPQLIGLTVPAAVEKLTAAGLTLGEKSFERGGQHPGGAIIAQSLSAGEPALPGQSVNLTIEEQMTQVPGVEGMAFVDAERLLVSLGLVIGETEKVQGNGAPGSVISQNPAEGTQVESGSAVSMRVKEQTIRMPNNLKGKTVQTAVAQLTRLGLRVSSVGYSTTRNKSIAGKISGHTPGPGAEAYVGTDIQLKVWRTLNVQLPQYTYHPATVAASAGITGIAVAANKQTCAKAVKNVALDYKGSKNWSNSNIAKLCKSAETMTAPAQCFRTVMHGGVNYGTGTKWAAANAINLCSGTKNANKTVQCFKSKIAARQTWQNAIPQCNRTLYKAGIVYSRNLPND